MRSRLVIKIQTIMLSSEMSHNHFDHEFRTCSFHECVKRKPWKKVWSTWSAWRGHSVIAIKTDCLSPLANHNAQLLAHKCVPQRKAWNGSCTRKEKDWCHNCGLSLSYVKRHCLQFSRVKHSEFHWLQWPEHTSFFSLLFFKCFSYSFSVLFNSRGFITSIWQTVRWSDRVSKHCWQLCSKKWYSFVLRSVL